MEMEMRIFSKLHQLRPRGHLLTIHLTTESRGFEQLGYWNLSVEDVTQISWANQQKYGARTGNNNLEDLLQSLIATPQLTLAREQYVFFDLLVCDFDANPWNDNMEGQVNVKCGDRTEANALCYFYAILNAACPCQWSAPGNWTWDGTKTPWSEMFRLCIIG